MYLINLQTNTQKRQGYLMPKGTFKLIHHPAKSPAISPGSVAQNHIPLHNVIIIIIVVFAPWRTICIHYANTPPPRHHRHKAQYLFPFWHAIAAPSPPSSSSASSLSVSETRGRDHTKLSPTRDARRACRHAACDSINKFICQQAPPKIRARHCRSLLPVTRERTNARAALQTPPRYTPLYSHNKDERCALLCTYNVCIQHITKPAAGHSH